MGDPLAGLRAARTTSLGRNLASTFWRRTLFRVGDDGHGVDQRGRWCEGGRAFGF